MFFYDPETSKDRNFEFRNSREILRVARLTHFATIRERKRKEATAGATPSS